MAISLDVAQFFEYYDIINAKALGKRIGMNNSLISQYTSGKKEAGPKQIHKILAGIKQLGEELSSLELIEA